jgi:hypothetical protein
VFAELLGRCVCDGILKKIIHCESVHKGGEGDDLSSCHQTGVTLMRAILWKRIDLAVVVAVSIMALIIVLLTARLVEAEAPMALGSDWTCHKVPYIEICSHAAQGKRLPDAGQLRAEMRY